MEKCVMVDVNGLLDTTQNHLRKDSRGGPVHIRSPREHVCRRLSCLVRKIRPLWVVLFPEQFIMPTLIA